jgi:antitoxin FitA
VPDLHLESVPEELYRRIEQLAAAEHVPLTEEALRLLQDAVTRKPAHSARSQREILDNIVRNRYAPIPGTPDSVELLREDRRR